MYEYELRDLKGNIINTGTCEEIASYARVTKESIYQATRTKYVLSGKYKAEKVKIDKIEKKDPIWEEFDRITYEMKMLFKKLTESSERKTT